MLTKFLYVLLVYIVYAIVAIVTTVVSCKKNVSVPFYMIISMLEIGSLLVIWAILLF
jgi:hypothetical protein